MVWLAIAFFIAGCSLIAPTQQNEGELVLTLSLDANNYTTDAPIQATVQLQNAGKERPLVNRRMALSSPSAPRELREVVFVVIGPTGTELPLGARINLRLPQSSDFATLAPGAVIQRDYALRQFFSFHQPGQYTITAVYQNSSDPPSGNESWKGEVSSNSVTIAVR